MRVIIFFLCVILFSSCKNRNYVRYESDKVEIPLPKIELFFAKEKINISTSVSIKKNYLALYKNKESVSNQPWHMRKMVIVNNDTVAYKFVMNDTFFMFHNTAIHISECGKIRKTDKYYNMCINSQCWSKGYWEYPVRETEQIIRAKSKVEVLVAFPLILSSCCQPPNAKIDTVVLRHHFNKVTSDNSLTELEVNLKLTMNGDSIVSQQQILSEILW